MVCKVRGKLVARLYINTLALFDRSAIFAGSADLRDVTFAWRHGAFIDGGITRSEVKDCQNFGKGAFNQYVAPFGSCELSAGP